MKKILNITFGSFTIMMILFTFFRQFDLAPEINNETVLLVLIISTSIALLMELSDKIQNHYDISSIWIDLVVRISICYVVVFIACASFGVVSFSLFGLWEITPTLILCFPLTYFYTVYMNNELAESINQAIQKRNKIE
ncbi:hypothetical protein [Anaerorhabdus furcosa]|uniref:DUF3021 domain-containing protein n=1 Tax=Anaerorhabdus furcosa TaxID=118967 RepID=A0A1T4NYB1_9FIRM|nr:hypothetical protein [Anaerorhabdus furcosa]SJZ84380.1 hypothetical protein SAMN02745191_1792 [Anaerorhabdus furcosa]